MNKKFVILLVIFISFLSCKEKNIVNKTSPEEKEEQSVENSEEKLICDIIFSKKEELSEKYIFESINILVQEGNIERFVNLNDEDYFILKLKNENEYTLINHSKISMPKEDTDVIMDDDDTPLYRYDGEKGGGHTYIKIFFRENKILVHIDYEYVDMSKIDGPV